MKKLIISTLCFLAAIQFSVAQSNIENAINKVFEEYSKDPVSVFKKYAPEDYVFITAEGVFWDKTKAIQRVSGAKLEAITLTEKKYKTVGEIVIFTGINSSKWVAGSMTINYKDAFTYVFQLKGNDIKWLSAQHSLVTPKDRNKALFREKVQLANERKPVDYAKYYAESFESKGFGKGPKAAEAHANSYLKAFPDLTLTIHELIAEGDLVMARCESSGTHKGEMAGIPATGKVGTIAHWTINRFNDEGKITESWNLNDTISMMRQLGVLK